jgi:putative oxidoreductase
LLLRAVIGGTIFAHGAQKLFGWFGGNGLRGTGSFFGTTGWRAPLLMALLAGLGESSGLAFAVGFLTPLAALGMVTVMLTAIVVVHWRNGFFNGNGGLEFPLSLATVAVAVAATGPGRFSIDRLIGWDDNTSGLWWGVAVAAAAIVVTAVNMTVFRKTERLQERPAT